MWRTLLPISILIPFNLIYATPQKIEQARSSVAQVSVHLEEGDFTAPIGSGFFVNDTKTFVLSLHSLIDQDEKNLYPLESIGLSNFNDNDSEVKVVGIKALSLLHDFVVFEVEGYLGPFLKFGSLNTTPEEVYALGFTQNSKYTMQTIYGHSVSLEGDMLEFAGNIFNPVGASGGPILNTKAQVIGMLTIVLVNYIEAEKAIHIKNLIDKNTSLKTNLQSAFQDELSRVSRLANTGNKSAQFAMGMWSTIIREFEEAIKWYSMASKQEHIRAKRNLGFIYFDTPEDKRSRLKTNGLDEFKAQTLLEEAANAGDVLSHYILGIRHVIEDGESNATLASQYLRLPAERGHADALFMQGMQHLVGKGAEKNMTKATELFQKALDTAKHPDAQGVLELMERREKTQQ